MLRLHAKVVHVFSEIDQRRMMGEKGMDGAGLTSPKDAESGGVQLYVATRKALLRFSGPNEQGKWIYPALPVALDTKFL